MKNCINFNYPNETIFHFVFNIECVYFLKKVKYAPLIFSSNILFFFLGLNSETFCLFQTRSFFIATKDVFRRTLTGQVEFSLQSH